MVKDLTISSNESVLDNDAEITNDTTVISTDIHGPNDRDNRVWSSPEKAYEQFTTPAIARERDQAAFDADREQARRHAEDLHKQALRHADELHVVTLQTLSGSQVADQGIDAIVTATVNALVAAGVVSKSK